MPNVSVVLPVYNAADTIDDCLDSLMNQDYDDFEIVAVDDGSTDGSREILERVQGQSSRIRVLINGQNLGLAASLNRAISGCQSPWIARQDADDWSDTSRLRRQIDVLSRAPDVGFAGTGFAITDDDGTVLSTSAPPSDPEVLRRVLLRRNLMAHGSVMFRRDLFESVGGYREFFRLAQDYDLWLRMLEVSEATVIEDVLYFHRLGTETSGSRHKNRQEWFARTARRCAQLRQAGVTDDLAAVQAEPVRAPLFADAALVRGVCLLKGGHVDEARVQFRRCFSSGGLPVRFAAVALALVSLAPSSLIDRLRRLRWRWESR